MPATPGVALPTDGICDLVSSLAWRHRTAAPRRAPVHHLVLLSAQKWPSSGFRIEPGRLGSWVNTTRLFHMTHIAKTGSRALINTSPEPFSNVAASLTEDVAVIGGLALAIAHPITFLCLLAAFVALLVWLLPKLVRLALVPVRRLIGRPPKS